MKALVSSFWGNMNIQNCAKICNKRYLKYPIVYTIGTYSARKEIPLNILQQYIFLQIILQSFICFSSDTLARNGAVLSWKE